MEEKLEATWHALKPHIERGVLIVISRELEVAAVAEALTKDQAGVVEEWMGQGLVSKPKPDQVELWDKEPMRLFWMLIVQPFVLMQELSETEEQAFRPSNIQA